MNLFDDFISELASECLYKFGFDGSLGLLIIIAVISFFIDIKVVQNDQDLWEHLFCWTGRKAKRKSHKDFIQSLNYFDFDSMRSGKHNWQDNCVQSISIEFEVSLLDFKDKLVP